MGAEGGQLGAPPFQQGLNGLLVPPMPWPWGQTFSSSSQRLNTFLACVRASRDAMMMRNLILLRSLVVMDPGLRTGGHNAPYIAE